MGKSLVDFGWFFLALFGEFLASIQSWQSGPLAVIIAMKMEYVIKAPKTGTVTKVPHKIGDFVTKGTALVEFADEEWCNRKNNWLIDLDIY